MIVVVHNSATNVTVHCRAILFDLDGVLVDSRRCIERIWCRWAAIHGLDPYAILRIAHGRRISESLREVAPHLDPQIEVALLDEMEENELEGVHSVASAVELVARLPPERWAVVTSASPRVAHLRLRVSGVLFPRVLVTAADIRKGKPDPEGYLLAAERLDVSPEACLVIEDAPAGVAAGKAAGMVVVGLSTTHLPERLAEAGADFVLPGLEAVQVAEAFDGFVRLVLTSP